MPKKGVIEFPCRGTFALTKEQHAFADAKVKDGSFKSIAEILRVGLEKQMKKSPLIGMTPPTGALRMSKSFIASTPAKPKGARGQMFTSEMIRNVTRKAVKKGKKNVR